MVDRKKNSESVKIRMKSEKKSEKINKRYKKPRNTKNNIDM